MAALYDGLPYQPRRDEDGVEFILLTEEGGYMKDYLPALLTYDGMLTQAQAAKIADVSQQRIHQLVSAGRLRLVKVGVQTARGVVPLEELIPVSELREWMGSPRHPGARPNKRPGPRELLPVG